MPDDVALPSLLREARGAYALAIKQALGSIGLGDLPPNSAFVLGGLHAGIEFKALARHRQRGLDRAGTVAALLAADCVEEHNGDVILSERGHEAAHVCAAALEQLDAHVEGSIGADGVGSMRGGLIALIEWKEDRESH